MLDTAAVGGAATFFRHSRVRAGSGRERLGSTRRQRGERGAADDDGVKQPAWHESGSSVQRHVQVIGRSGVRLEAVAVMPLRRQCPILVVALHRDPVDGEIA
jgi:hypothetical protein